MSLQGILSDFGVADVFQLIAQQRKTGLLDLESEERKLTVFFQEGQVVRARPAETRPDGALAALLLRVGGISEPQLADVWRQQEESLEPLERILTNEGIVGKQDLEQVARLLSDETIFELFLWDDGHFAFRPHNVEQRIGDLMVGAEMVLLDALRMRDEWPGVSSGLSDLAVLLAQVVDVEGFRERRAAVESATGMRGEELDRLWTVCNGRLTARRVIDLSRLGTFQGARGLVALLREGVLRVEHKAARPQKSTRVISAPSSWGLGAWILVLTGLVAAGLFVVPAPMPRSHPMPRPGLEEGRSAAAVQRVRTALEAHRWRTGNYPESLAELRTQAGAFLASVSLDRYSYARSAGGYSLAEE